MVRTTAMLVAVIALLTAAAWATPLADAIELAEGHREAGRLQEAVSVMEKAVADNPESPKAHAYLGLYLG
ncbi:MAG: tetratricopeptide repeat protein, partial [Candidatus Eisenbacteria bacterium]|nr:tetratricopeptide repeat protein [Candidatus Eisenbacteria bacterium]